MKKIFTTLAAVASVIMPAMAIETADLVGQYDWEYTSELAMDGGKKTAVVEIVKGTSPKTVVIKGMYLTYGFVADVNEAENTLSLRSQSVDFDFNMNAMSYLYKVTSDGETTTAEKSPLVAKINEDGSIEFRADEMIGIGFANTAGQDDMYYLLAAKNVMKPYVDKTFVYSPDEWQDAGKGYLYDGWLAYHYLEDAFDDGANEYEVTVQRNVANPNIFCILNPFDNETLRPFNQDKKAVGYMIFDTTNPKFVKMRTHVYSGFTDEELGKLYMYDQGTHQSEVAGLGDEATLKQYPLNVCYLQDNTIFIQDPLFGTEARPTGCYGWGSLQSTITLPDVTGIEQIEADDNEAPVYYTLTGQRVANPDKGIYIVKQGSKVTKVIL